MASCATHVGLTTARQFNPGLRCAAPVSDLATESSDGSQCGMNADTCREVSDKMTVGRRRSLECVQRNAPLSENRRVGIFCSLLYDAFQ
jgi:hypothetical protein